MSATSVEQGWEALLRVREAVGLRDAPVGLCYFRLATEGGGRPVSLDRPFRASTRSSQTVAVILDPSLPVPPPSRADAVLAIDGLIGVRTVRAGGLPQPLLQLFKTYLPYAFSSMHARRLGRAFAVSHFAQSLDGRIATLAGRFEADRKPVQSRPRPPHARAVRRDHHRLADPAPRQAPPDGPLRRGRAAGPHRPGLIERRPRRPGRHRRRRRLSRRRERGPRPARRDQDPAPRRRTAPSRRPISSAIC